MQLCSLEVTPYCVCGIADHRRNAVYCRVLRGTALHYLYCILHSSEVVQVRWSSVGAVKRSVHCGTLPQGTVQQRFATSTANVQSVLR